MGDPRVQSLLEQLDAALKAEERGDAIEAYEQLELLEPFEARWPHHRGNLLRELGSRMEAAKAYHRAVDLYESSNQVSRALAMAKAWLQLEPESVEVVERVAALANRSSWGPPAPREHSIDSDLYPAADPSSAVEITEEDIEELSADDVELISDAPPAGTAAVPADRAVPFSQPVEYESLYPHSAQPEHPSTAEQQDASTPPRLDAGDDTSPRISDVGGPLESIPLFQGLEERVQERLFAKASPIQAQAGSTLYEAGNEAETLFAVLEGSVQLMARSEVGAGELFPVATLTVGDVFGESCLLDDATLQNSATALVDSKLLSFDKSLIDELVSSDEEFEKQLFALLSGRCLRQLLATSELFESLDESMRESAAGLFQASRAEAGDTVLELGHRSSGLHLLVAGSLLQHQGSDVKTLMPVAVFGHGSLVGQQEAETTITCVSDALLLSVPDQRFAEFAAMYPTVLMALAEYGTTPRKLRVSLPPPMG